MVYAHNGQYTVQAYHPGPMKRHGEGTTLLRLYRLSLCRRHPPRNQVDQLVDLARSKSEPGSEGGRAEVVNWFDMEPVRPWQAADGL